MNDVPKKDMKLIIVDDEKILRVSISDELREAGYDVKDFADPVVALRAMRENPVDVVITDIKLPKMDGIQLLTRLKSAKPDTMVIVMTAYGSVNSAVEAMKAGAYDYITKPFQIDELKMILERIEELQAVKQENIRLRSHFESQYTLDAFVGESHHVQEIRELVKTIAQTATTVLIMGETGCGKELLANIIHYNSDRLHKSFVKVSCSVFSRTIFESELFGHAKGAFTGAIKERKGRFEEADGGTIYLDDVDDIPLDLQVNLLRVLEEREFERVGSNKTIQVDVRTIASTKSDLKKLVKDEKFRKDLYYRLNVFPIYLAPLRERAEDIPVLVQHFVDQFAPGEQIEMNPDVIECMKEYQWEGNVRELKNMVERLLLMSRGQKKIDTSNLLFEFFHPDGMKKPDLCLKGRTLHEVLDEIESDFIRQTLVRTGGNQAKAARLLGIPPSTLRTKMNKYRLKQQNGTS
jgi:DNA-binding NtrC family response regulator